MSSLLKICGLRDPENIREVIRLKPDLIGMIFYPKSPRFVARPEDLAFLNELPHRPLTVGVFVNPELEDIRWINAIVRMDVVQLHGTESPEFCDAVHAGDHAVIKAFGIQPGFDFCLTEAYRRHADYFLFDTKAPGFGGSGDRFDWDLLDFYHGDTSYFLSGGLAPDTRIFPNHPQMAGIDINSRFETEPGIKDISLLENFINHFRHGQI